MKLQYGAYSHTQQILSKNLVQGQLSVDKMPHKYLRLFTSEACRTQNRTIYSDGADRHFHRLHQPSTHVDWVGKHFLVMAIAFRPSSFCLAIYLALTKLIILTKHDIDHALWLICKL